MVRSQIVCRDGARGSRQVAGRVAVTLAALVMCTPLLSDAVTPVPSNGALMPPSQFLPEKPGFTSWRTLGQVELVKQDRKLLPSFAQPVVALDGKTIRVQGFMMPLDIGDKQRRFLLVAAPPHCSYCLPAGPDAMIEVRAKSDVRYGFDAIALTGKLQLLKDDPAGLYYRLLDAVLVQ
ncbi:MAG: DUF3299 domain-containing protein [Burkholderiales bacterium]|nr:DUF3299 domain-containing protein [Burkholderiales bacterium]